MKSIPSLRVVLPALLLAAFVLMANAGGPLCWDEAEKERVKTERAAPAAEDGRSTQERERLLAMGRELFFERCGSCHDADGSKPMADGPPLSQRRVPEEKVSRVVDSRFKKATEEQRRAVKLHINKFMKR
ncbi:MAG: c-type cytochrome [Terriglobales bacterium]